MARSTTKLAAALRGLQTQKPALNRRGRLAKALDVWVIKQKARGRCQGNWVCRRDCHGYAEPSCHNIKLASKRLGLRIISSNIDASDASSNRQNDSGQEKDTALPFTIARDERHPFSGGVKYSVIRINDDGTWEPLILNTPELGVHAKDLDLLAGNFFIPKRSAIAVRNNQILIKMENVRALICKTHCLLFDAHRPRRESFKSFANGDATKPNRLEPSQHAREAFASLMADHAKRLLKDNQNMLPFHLCMIECLLDETCSFFHQKVERLKLVADRMLEELTTDVSTGGLQRLLPLKRALTVVEHDIRDTHEAMDQILGNDDALDALCLKDGEGHAVEGEAQQTISKKEQQSNKIRQAAAEMIVSYQREIDDVGGALEEMRKGMESAQEV